MNLKAYLYAGLLVALVVAGLYIRHAFVEREQYKQQAAFERSEKDKAINTIAKQLQDAKREQKVLEVYNDAQEKIVYRDRVVTKEVIKYRDSPNRCKLSIDWLRIANSALAPIDLPSSPGTTDAPTASP